MHPVLSNDDSAGSLKCLHRPYSRFRWLEERNAFLVRHSIVVNVALNREVILDTDRNTVQYAEGLTCGPSLRRRLGRVESELVSPVGVGPRILVHGGLLCVFAGEGQKSLGDLQGGDVARFVHGMVVAGGVVMRFASVFGVELRFAQLDHGAIVAEGNDKRLQAQGGRGQKWTVKT